MKGNIRTNNVKRDIFAGFSNDWGGDMASEDYADMLRNENIENTRTVESW